MIYGHELDIQQAIENHRWKMAVPNHMAPFQKLGMRYELPNNAAEFI